MLHEADELVQLLSSMLGSQFSADSLLGTLTAASATGAGSAAGVAAQSFLHPPQLCATGPLCGSCEASR